MKVRIDVFTKMIRRWRKIACLRKTIIVRVALKFCGKGKSEEIQWKYALNTNFAWLNA